MCEAAAAVQEAIVVDRAHLVDTFTPMRTIGAGVDSQNDGAIAKIYAADDVRAMLSSGLGPVSYRLYTELSVQDWHWNPRGSWSDRAGRGYWTGSTEFRSGIRDTYGYRLPHRGFTHDQGNDDDFLRLDDGDAQTYWKSNPYLTQRYTHEPDERHPQWVVLDLGSSAGVDAASIEWATPYARDYAVQYWAGDDAINDPGNGRWVTFPSGLQRGGSGGDVVLPLARAPVAVRFVRISMTRSSNTCDSHGSGDPRNCAGYAIAEVGLGTLDRGIFRDLVVHRVGRSQTTTFASSVDPWHEPRNRVTDQEQPGLDVVYRSSLTRGLPAMLSVGMLYGTPDDAAAQIRYVERRGYPISYVELGEEPDGQSVLPEDDAALYIQWARALHAVDPQLRLGGPVFQGVTSDVQTWPDARGNVSWLNRFLAYLAAHGSARDLTFMSFEHYPFDPCGASLQQNLVDEPGLMRSIVAAWRADGLPKNVPLMITEMNYSAAFTPVPQELAGALWYAQSVGAFIAAGGSGAYLYEYEPVALQPADCGWGNLNLWNADANYRVRQPAAQFFAARIMMDAWAQAVDAPHRAYAATVHDVERTGALSYLDAYPLLRPDGTWAVMVVNADLVQPHTATVHFVDGGGERTFSGPVIQTTFGPQQYIWHAAGAGSFAKPDGPERVETVAGGNRPYRFPAASITVLRGMLAR